MLIPLSSNRGVSQDLVDPRTFHQIAEANGELDVRNTGFVVVLKLLYCKEQSPPATSRKLREIREQDADAGHIPYLAACGVFQFAVCTHYPSTRSVCQCTDNDLKVRQCQRRRESGPPSCNQRLASTGISPWRKLRREARRVTHSEGITVVSEDGAFVVAHFKAIDNLTHKGRVGTTRNQSDT